MNINIYEMYKIKYKCEVSRLSEENETIYDNIFVHDNYEKEYEIDGGKLINEISAKLQDNYLSEFVIVGEDLHFEFFNYNNGESSSECITILGSEPIFKDSVD